MARETDTGQRYVTFGTPDGSTPTAIPISDASTTASLSNVASSATNVTILAINTNRVRGGVVIMNESSAILYIKYGTTASLTSYTYQLPANSVWEMPSNVHYTGRIDGIWSAANGTARITELTP